MIDNTNEIFKYRYKKCEGDELTLFISEVDQQAYLPYKYVDIKKILEENPEKYHTTSAVLQDNYIIPLSTYKNSSFARFRETYKLMKYKENKSLFDAIDFSLELMFKYNLNPLIITACKNLDELYLYLDCLEKDALDEFKCFKIKFEILPAHIQ